jgi:2-oxoacid:acceptor oxidoreductase gamma subunit (pyruvate/2-ketoisovalerate family)
MTDDDKGWDVVNIVILGRGGQGAVTASEIIAEAAYLSGNFVDVHAYPSFGAERRGAPIQSYAKLSKKEKLWDRSQIQNPHIVIVLDVTVFNETIASSLKEDGIILIDSDQEPRILAEKYNISKEIQIFTADISNMAIKKELTIEGAPVVNVGILGLLSKAISEIELDNLKQIINKRMSKDLGEKNVSLMEDVYKIAKKS